ncbi:hypothetical protein HPB49_021037 [Dermacentor silvarum]|uniref:Uncharacterized protein n=1 Tax=Dermacentor silvarum TaxID=543639 RepID=A0ACB8CSS4_DERSI|nr:hypothetical protein HPB49_021037 [Dermacentor silvarum]
MPNEVTGREIAPSEVSVSNGWCDIAPRRTTKPNLNVAANVAAYGARTKASKPAIQEAAGLETTQCDGDTIYPNLKQNIMVVSSPLPENVHGYLKIQSITITGQTYEASSYRTAPDDTCKGVIRNIPLHHTQETITSQQLGPASQSDNGMPGLRNGGDAAHKPRAVEGQISGELASVARE